MGSSTPRYRTLEELSGAPSHLRRFRAVQTVLGREVELRTTTPEAGEEGLSRFLQELELLALLEDPAFPSIMDRGGEGPASYYTLALREDPPLVGLLADEEFGLEARVEVVRALALGLAAVHDEQRTLGFLDPRWVAVRRDREQPYFPFPLALPAIPEEVPEGALPRDLRADRPPSRAGDVFLWGWTAYRVLAHGAGPFDAGPRKRTPLRTLAPEVPRVLGELVEAALGWDPSHRPGSGGELREVLLAKPRRLTMMGSLVASVRWLAERRRAERDEDTARDVVREGGQAFLAVALAALLLGVGGAWLREGGAPQAASLSTGGYRRVQERSPELPTSGDLLELAPSTQARYRRDPRIRWLVTGEPATPETFARKWAALRKLTLTGKLPPQLASPREVHDIFESFRKDPEAACGRLDRYVKTLARHVGSEGT